MRGLHWLWRSAEKSPGMISELSPDVDDEETMALSRGKSFS